MKVVLICTIYMFIGPGLILLNKHILSDLQFPYPMFLSGLGVAVSALVARILVAVGLVTLTRREEVHGILWYKRVLPVGLAHAGTLAFGNIVYLLLNVGFIQMLKSFTPVIILGASVAANLENPNIPTIFAVLLMSLGTAATCTFTAQLSFLGVFVMFLAELTEAIRLLMTQFLLHHCKFGVIEGQYVLAPATAFWLFMASAIFEGPDLLRSSLTRDTGALDKTLLLPTGTAASSNPTFVPTPWEVMRENPLPFVLASTMGLCVNFMSYLVIQVTSSLTMKVLGSVRNIITIFFGVMLWGDVISIQATLGYAVTMTGFVAYNMGKSGSWERIQLPGFILKHRWGNYLQIWLDRWDQMRDNALSSPSSKDKGSGGNGSEMELSSVVDNARMGSASAVGVGAASSSLENSVATSGHVGDSETSNITGRARVSSGGGSRTIAGSPGAVVKPANNAARHETRSRKITQTYSTGFIHAPSAHVTSAAASSGMVADSSQVNVESDIDG